MPVTITPADNAVIRATLARRKASREETEKMIRRMAAITPNEFNLNMVARYDSGRAAEIDALRDRRVVASLSTHPKQRLLDALAYWLPIEQSDRDEDTKDFSMLPWLLRIQKHLEADDLDAALLEMRDMKRSLQGCVPDGLDLGGDEWVDVTFA